MKWVSSRSGELNISATYFSPFANVKQTNKTTIGGSVGGPETTWKQRDYQKRIQVAKRVEQFKNKLGDPEGKTKRRRQEAHC